MRLQLRHQPPIHRAGGQVAFQDSPLSASYLASCEAHQWEYREATPAAKRNTLEVWEVMLKAEQKMVKAIHAKNFEKYIFVANKNNGDAFFDKVILLIPLF